MLFIVSLFAVPDSNFKVWVDRAAMEISSTTGLLFESMDAKNYEVTEEKNTCRNWYEENILSTENPAYTFKVGGKDFRKNIDDWDFSSLDYAWVDAGWYPLRNNWSDSVGNWYADTERYPDGHGRKGLYEVYDYYFPETKYQKTGK
ncbi:MAG: hypothetical protein IJF20_03055 [Clostridia bacterium]|nr:hypothetical protein [Clostridia bacterium]